MGGNVLVLLSKSTEEVLNRKSALGALVYSVSKLLKAEGKSVYINNVHIDNAKEISQLPDYTPSFPTRIIKRLIPKFIKRYFRDRNNIKKVNGLFSDILKNNVTYDFVVEFYSFGSRVGLEISKQQSIPLFIIYDNPTIDEYKIFNGDKLPFFLKIIKKNEVDTLLGANKIVAYSDAAKDYLLEITNHKLDASKIEYFQNVDYSRFDVFDGEKKFDLNPVNICFIGSFLKWHEVNLLIEAFVYLLENEISAQLFLVGDGMEKNRIYNLVQDLSPKIKSKITFTGYLDGKELYELKKKMHVGVMSGSNWYGAPTKLFEYSAMKMAVIGPDTPTIKFIFKGSTIMLFEWGNVKSLTAKLYKLCTDPKQVESNAESINQFVLNKYTIENSVKFYKKLFEM